MGFPWCTLPFPAAPQCEVPRGSFAGAAEALCEQNGLCRPRRGGMDRDLNSNKLGNEPELGL